MYMTKTTNKKKPTRTKAPLKAPKVSYAFTERTRDGVRSLLGEFHARYEECLASFRGIGAMPSGIQLLGASFNPQIRAVDVVSMRTYAERLLPHLIELEEFAKLRGIFMRIVELQPEMVGTTTVHNGVKITLRADGVEW
jgi:hypothetical protein